MLLRAFMLTTYVVFFSIHLFAQQPTQTIRGTVIDNSSNAPISSANVIITSLSKGAITDSAGNFVLKNIPVGRYDIQVSFIGYEAAILREIVVSSGKETFLNISLKETAK